MSLFEERLERAREIQQQFYATSSDWNVFCRTEPDLLKNYIGLTIYGGPDDIEGNRYIYKNDKIKEGIEKMFSQIETNSDQTELIYCIALYCVTFESEKTLKKLQSKEDAKKNENKNEKVNAEKNKKDTSEEKEKDASVENENEGTPEQNEDLHIGCRTFFKIRKEKFEKGKLPEHYTWFVDWDYRVYKSWEDFMNKNNLHPCTMVVPKDGEYQLDPNQEYSETMTHVLIEHHQSPACKNGWVGIVDWGSSILQVASLGVGVASIFTPVAPLVIAVGTGVGIATGGYSTTRTVSNIWDRKKHKESMTDRRAIGDYISIGANVLGAASMGASRYIARAALQGEEIGRAALIAHDCVAFSSVACKGTEIGHKIYGMITGDEEVTWNSCVFLVADIFFFSNIVIDMKTAKSLIQQQQTGFIENHKKSLTKKRHRKSFNKMAKKADNANEIIQKIRKAKTPEELAKLMPTNTSSASRSNTMNVAPVSGSTSVIADIRNEWPQYSTLIISTITNFIPKVLEKFQNGELSKSHEWYSLIFEFLWSIIKPLIRTMIKDDIARTLYNILETQLDKIVSDFKEFLKRRNETPFENEQPHQSSSNESNSNNPVDYDFIIANFVKHHDLSVSDESVKKIKKIFEEVDTNLPDKSEDFISALLQMSLFVLNSVNIVDVKSDSRTLLLAISFLWDKFQEMIITKCITTADECVLMMFDNSEDKLTEMMAEFEEYLFSSL